MKNLLFLHSSSELYGSDRSLLNIAKNIDKNRYRVFVILPCTGPLVDEMKKVEGISVDIFEVAVLRRKNLSVRGFFSYMHDFNISMKYLRNFIKENKIDLVYTNTAVVFPGAICAKKCGIKSIWHIREIIKSSLENRIISFMMQRYSDLIIANSKSTGQALAVCQDKVRVVYNAVDECDCRDKTPHIAVTVGMAGRINRWKGQRLFVDMAAEVVKKHPDTVFKIAGEPYAGEEQLKADLESYISEKGLEESVSLLGQVTDMPDFYRSIDIFVLPSTQPEPFGLVVIEAMEFSLPVVATNHGGPVEILTNGVDGFLVDYNDCHEMTDKVCLLIENSELRSRMGHAATEKKHANFSVSSMVKGIEDVFNSALEK